MVVLRQKPQDIGFLDVANLCLDGFGKLLSEPLEVEIFVSASLLGAVQNRLILVDDFRKSLSALGDIGEFEVIFFLTQESLGFGERSAWVMGCSKAFKNTLPFPAESGIVRPG